MVKGVQTGIPQLTQGDGIARGAQHGKEAAKQPFEAVLQKTMEARDLHFSRHAQDRMTRRNIEISADELDRMKGAVDQAEKKGVKESLFLLDHNAFIVSVENRTVITALDRENVKNNMFTNIDSAVLL